MPSPTPKPAPGGPASSGKDRFHVLLDDPSALAPSLPVAARVLAQVLAEHPTDVASRIRYGGGVVARAVTEPYAREISRGLAAVGLGSFLVPSVEFSAPPRPRRVGVFEPDAGGVWISQRLRDPERKAWGDVLAVHAHVGADPSASDDGEGPPRRGGDVTQMSEDARRLLGDLRAFEERERVRLVASLDVLVAGPVLYRMTSDDPGIYGALASRSTMALENYLALVRRVVEVAPAGVLVPGGTRRFAASADLSAVLYAKREELDAFNSWVIHALAEGVALRGPEPEEVDDEGLEDEDEAIVVGGATAAAHAQDADDLDDLAEDELDDDDDEDDEQDDDAQVDAPAADPEVARAAALFERTERLDARAVQSILADARSLGDTGTFRLSAEERDAVAGDPEVAQAAALFEQSGRLDASDVRSILAGAAALDEVEADPAAVDPEVAAAASFFEPSSGRWDVQQVLQSADEVDDEDLEAE